jgi:sulfur-oxidizing protein SoxX
MCTQNIIRTVIFYVLVLFTQFALSACTGEGTPVKGFVLPQGDIARGKQVFVDFNCHGCHTIPEMEFPETDSESPFILEIGGKVYRVKNYGELMTSIVYPNHVISPKYSAKLEKPDRAAAISPMPYYGETMTVAELIDLVEFLHAQYTKLQPHYYRGYHRAREN